MSSLRMGTELIHLLQSQWWPPSRLQALQDKKLRAIIRYAYATIPLYHRKFKDAGISPDDIRTASDLVKVPMLTKQEIQQYYPTRIVAPHIDIAKCWTPFTSGSTGNPVTIVYDPDAEAFQKACALRPNISCGQGPFDRWAIVASPRTIIRKMNKRWFQRMGMFSPECMSLFDDVRTHMHMLELMNPQVLDGYTSSLFLIAKEKERTGDDSINPRLVYTTSELLTTQMRRYINTAFNVELFDQFGSVEMGRTAWECPEHCGYHMDMEAVVTEFIKDGNPVAPGERGEIIYTNLYNYAMPLIRLRTKDIGIPSDLRCSCGRRLPMMKVIEGRVDDFVVLPNGKVLPPITWIILLMYYRIDQFKIIQESTDTLHVLIVPKTDCTKETLASIRSDVERVTDHLLQVTLESVPAIDREASGKTRPIISKVKWNGCCG